MLLSQRTELRRLLAPELKQSLKILTLPYLELKSVLDEELVNNPFLEEAPAQAAPAPYRVSRARKSIHAVDPDDNFDPFSQLTKPPSLQDVLLRQLRVSAENDQSYNIGVDIIGNLDEKGFLKASVAEIAVRQRVEPDAVEKVLRTVQRFEPAGVGARTIQECLLIQCSARGEKDPLMQKIIEGHLQDVAQRKFSLIARQLEASPEDVEACVKKITALTPNPGQNYSSDQAFDIAPDIFIDEKDGDLEIFLNQEYLPSVKINEEYRTILKKNNLPPEQKEYLKQQLENALDLIRAVTRRRGTLRKVIDVIVGIQKEALTSGLSHLKPMTLQEVADKIGMHESTVSRVVMNKYAQTPQGLIALKDLFTSSIPQENGESVSSTKCKDLIRDLIDAENKQKPLSDEELTKILMEQEGIKLARRTVAKYREELKLPSSTLRRTR